MRCAEEGGQKLETQISRNFPARNRKVSRSPLSPSSSSAAVTAAAMLSGDVPPNQTLYLRNLNEKIKKEGTTLAPAA